MIFLHSSGRGKTGVAVYWWRDAWTSLPDVLAYRMLDFRGDDPSISLETNALVRWTLDFKWTPRVILHANIERKKLA